jgi:hypothetical protein
LPCRIPNGLRQRRRRNRNPHAALLRARHEREHAAVVPVESDQPPGVERDVLYAALLGIQIGSVLNWKG